jgi:hypothetical protein
MLETLTRKGQIKICQFKCRIILLNAEKGLSDPQFLFVLNVNHHLLLRLLNNLPGLQYYRCNVPV